MIESELLSILLSEYRHVTIRKYELFSSLMNIMSKTCSGCLRQDKCWNTEFGLICTIKDSYNTNSFRCINKLIK